ncbi:hypothetical protein CHS0354_038260 [Potamilus streckersoni]|uniref:Uncharacterized protein n=1 Tax=Potamilus streckersoni TaxID=2493646 RepID=A0AAE0RU58_9BIVA|nr:hypothetical protein CHS0354_038260 [Potamilus streckersoni]
MSASRLSTVTRMRTPDCHPQIILYACYSFKQKSFSCLQSAERGCLCRSIGTSTAIQAEMMHTQQGLDCSWIFDRL